MKKKSNKRKLFTAAASLLLSAVMLSTSTYAWFTMNKEVEINNIQLQVKTSSNLLISATNLDDSTYGTKLEKNLYALLEPTSTVDGVNYYYTLDGAGDGHKIHGPDAENPYVKYNENATLTAEDTYAEKTKYDSNFNNAYGISTANPTAADKFLNGYGYLDYIMYLKANTTAANQKVVMNKCNLLYNGATVTEKAWRVALLVQETAAETQSTTDGNLITIIGLDGAENQTESKAVNSTTTVGTITNENADAIVVNNLAANTTKYYKVVIRVWIEGEDTTCTSEIFGTKTDNYSLQIDFSIEEDAEAVSSISSEV